MGKTFSLRARLGPLWVVAKDSFLPYLSSYKFHFLDTLKPPSCVHILHLFLLLANFFFLSLKLCRLKMLTILKIPFLSWVFLPSLLYSKQLCWCCLSQDFVRTIPNPPSLQGPQPLPTPISLRSSFYTGSQADILLFPYLES